MSGSRYLIFGLIVFLVLFFLAIPDPQISQKLQNADFPWNIKIHEDGSSEVFGLKPGTSTLQDAASRFHEPEEVAIYRGKQNSSLEAYFGTVKIGPLEAKLILTLTATAQEIQQMLERAKGLALSNSEDRKIKLSAADEAATLKKTINGITFIPKYSGLESDFFKERFGEPVAWLRLSENAVTYYYPQKGLSITIDAKGKEVLQYSHPAKFSIPVQATGN